MLTSIQLTHYRGFRTHKVPLRNSTIIVGRNNAGKSTIVEAIRLVSIVVNRAPFLLLKDPPDWADLPLRYRGVSPSLKGTDFDFPTLSYRYGDESIKIAAEFSSGVRVSIYLSASEQEIFAVFFNSRNHHLIISRSNHAKLLPRMSVQPGVGPLAREERELNEDYVRSQLETRLAPLHFRNQLAYLYENYFAEFVEMAESTWPGLGIDGLD